MISNKGTGRFTFIAMVTAFLLGCGGGGGGGDSASNNPSTPTGKAVSGVAAIGAPIAGGTVALRCASGNTVSAITTADGSWAATVKDGDFPCVIRVSGGQADGNALAQPLHSVVQEAGNVNVTPLTDLMVSIMVGQAPQAWFDSATNGGISGAVSATALANAEDKLLATLASLPGKPVLPENFNPLTSKFNAQKGDAGDDLLESYGAAIKAAGLTQTEAVSHVATGKALTQEAFAVTAFTTPNMTGFRAGAAVTNGGEYVLSIPDPNRGASVTKAVLGSDGNISEIATPYTNHVSLLSNRIGQLCVADPAAATQDGNVGMYAYVSEDWTPVQDTTELYGKVFGEYENCVNSGTSEFKSDDSSVFTANGEAPNQPPVGISKALTKEGLEVPGAGVVSHAKAYKATIDGKLVYAYIAVTTAKGATAPAIGGDANFVVMGISR